MRRKGSYIAGEIIRDMKLEEAYRKKQRAKCKEKQCFNCEYSRICSEKNEGKEGEERI